VTGDPELRALTLPFSEEELTLLSDRAAAHGVSILDFVRLCALTKPTPLEALSPQPSDDAG
jgi:hypothetical protein